MNKEAKVEKEADKKQRKFSPGEVQKKKKRTLDVPHRARQRHPDDQRVDRVVARRHGVARDRARQVVGRDLLFDFFFFSRGREKKKYDDEIFFFLSFFLSLSFCVSFFSFEVVNN